MTREDIVETHAREKAGMPPEWQVWRFKWLPDQPHPDIQCYMELAGAIAPEFKSGPRKGRTNWKAKDPATIRVVVITKAEHGAWLVEWERKTGKCAECVGIGVSVWKRTCRKCEGTGKARVTEAVMS
jgi:hypothetical protein